MCQRWPLPAIPGCRWASPDGVATRVEATLAGENPSATEALQSRVVAEALGEVTRGVVASEEFRQTWEATNREAHRFSPPSWRRDQGNRSPRFVALLDDIEAEVEAADVDVPPDLDLDAEALRIEVLDAETADRVRRGLERLDLAFGRAGRDAPFAHSVGGSCAGSAGGDRSRGIRSDDRDDRSHGADAGDAGMADRARPARTAAVWQSARSSTRSPRESASRPSDWRCWDCSSPDSALGCTRYAGEHPAAPWPRGSQSNDVAADTQGPRHS